MIPLTLTSLALALLSGPAHAADVRQVRGDALRHTTWSVDPANPCLQTTTYLTAYEEVEQENSDPGAPTFGAELRLSIMTFDACIFRTVGSESGVMTDGVIEPGGPTPRLQGTISLYDYVSGTTRDVAVDLTADPVGEVVHTVLQIVYDMPDGQRHSRGTGHFQDALLSGVIDGETLTEETARLESYIDGTITR